MLDAGIAKIYGCAMTQPEDKPTPDAVRTPQAIVYAERALVMMRNLTILPTPKHYSVFFACAAGQPTELVRVVERAIHDKKPFTDDYLDMLYTTYLAEQQARAVHDSASNAKKILTDMMQNVTSFAGTTSAAGADIEQQLAHLNTQSGEETLRLVAETLMQSATSIQDSSETMTQRLAGAQQEIMELRENLARVVTESERDFLTGSYNRKTFDRRLNELTDEAKAKKSELVLMMLDIDHFKRFNDKYGHLIGDEVLKIVAKTLADMLKGTDCIARYGGEEFGIILPRTPLKGGMVVAEMIRKAISSKELKRKTTGENFGLITVSIGLAAYRPESDTTQSLIERADNALYQSKNAGRNRVTAETIA